MAELCNFILIVLGLWLAAAAVLAIAWSRFMTHVKRKVRKQNKWRG